MDHTEEYTYIGTRLKYLIEIEANGFSMDDNEFEVEILRGPNRILYKKDDLETDEDGNWYVCFDTKDLGTGKITARITAYIPDEDFPGGFRDEVWRLELIPVKP